MKKLVFLFAVVAGFALASCGGKKAEKTENATADTMVIDYGTVQVDSVSPDSVEVAVMDTAVEVIATPETEKPKK